MNWALRILGLLATLVVVLFAGLWIASHRRDAGRMRGSIEVARPAESVWPWLTGPERLTQWVGWLAAVEPDSTTPAEGIGHRSVWVIDDPRLKQRVRLRRTVTLWEPTHQLGVHIESPGQYSGDAFYELTELDNGRTRLDEDVRVRYTDRFSRLLEPMMTPDAMRKMVEDLNRLRTKLEAEPFQADPGGLADSLTTAADSSGAASR